VKEIALGIAQIEELSVSQEVCCHKGSKHPGADNILTKQAVLIHKASWCHNSTYTSSYPYHTKMHVILCYCFIFFTALEVECLVLVAPTVTAEMFSHL